MQDRGKAFRPPVLPSAPSSPSAGDTYYNSTDGNLYTWDGVANAWVDLTLVSVAGSPTTIDGGNPSSVYSGGALVIDFGGVT